MKKTKIPTIVGIILLIVSLAFGVILVQNRQIFKLGATAEASPKNVRISNIKSNSFTVSWTTDLPTNGFIKYGLSVGNLSNTSVEEIKNPSYIHLVNVSNLSPETTYFFKINSKDSDFDNNGVDWQTKTTSQGQESEIVNLISGNVLLATGAPAKEVLVYLTINNLLYSTLTTTTGNWVLALPPNVNEKTSLLEISIQGGRDVSTLYIYPQSAKPVPTVVLGQTYDFKNLPASEGSDIPKASLGVPEEVTQTSGFDIPSGTSLPSTKTVTLESISNNEVITNVKPEFFGQGPVGTKIQITVQSKTITDSLTIPKSGEWNWEIPKNLPEGEHTITISWKDAAGILRTLTRSFVVQASEGPAFVSTPSATLKASLTPSPTPTIKATITPSPSSSPKVSPTIRPTLSATTTPTGTPFPQPESGSLTPTLLLSIMGIGLIATSFLFWKKSYV